MVDKALSFGIDKTQFAGIKLGKDGILDDGSVIENIKLVEPLKPDLTYAYCSDTLFNEKIIKPSLDNLVDLKIETAYFSLKEFSKLFKGLKNIYINSGSVKLIIGLNNRIDR